jgi:hypothetical protein
LLTVTLTASNPQAGPSVSDTLTDPGALPPSSPLLPHAVRKPSISSARHEAHVREIRCCLFMSLLCSLVVFRSFVDAARVKSKLAGASFVLHAPGIKYFSECSAH